MYTSVTLTSRDSREFFTLYFFLLYDIIDFYMPSIQEIQEGPYARFYERFGDPTEEIHLAYDSWLEDMAARPGTKLKPFEFNEDLHSEQSIYVPKVEAVPAYPHLPDALYYGGFRVKLMKSMGILASGRLINQMQTQPASSSDPTPLAERLNSNQAQGKNTLVVTSHINFQEFGYVKGLRHVAKRDRHNIDHSGALLNLLMTRQTYKGKKLVDHFTPLGAFYSSAPPSKTAEIHNVPKAPSDLVNALFKKVLRADLKAGGLELDAALTGSEVKPMDENGHVLDENGQFSHYFIPDIHPSSGKLVEDFDDALAITLVGPPIRDGWQMHISEILDVHELLKTNTYAEVIDMLYADNIVGALERFTNADVRYNRLTSRLGDKALNSI